MENGEGGEWSGRRDLNPGPHRPERCALPDCATPRGRMPINYNGPGGSLQESRLVRQAGDTPEVCSVVGFGLVCFGGGCDGDARKGHWRPLAHCAVPRLSRGLWRSAPHHAEGLQPAAPLRSMLSTDSSRARCPPEAPRLGRAPHRDAHRGQGSGIGPTTFCYSKFAGRTQSIYLRAPPGFLQQCRPNWRRFSIGGSRSAEALLLFQP